MMPLVFIIAFAVSVAVPFAFARLDAGPKWHAIGCSTLLTPFLILGTIKLVSIAWWALYPGSGSGCSGGECGGEATPPAFGRC